MKYTNKKRLPEPFVRAVTNDPYPSNPTWDISATKLLKPPQMNQLAGKYKDEITEDVSDRFWALLGQCTHSVLERAMKDTKSVEIRLEGTYSGKTDLYKVSGQADYYEASTYTIWDYKFTSMWAVLDAKKNGKEDWKLQLNILRDLFMNHGFRVDNLKILAFSKDYSPRKAGKDVNEVEVITIPIMSTKAIREFIQSKLIENFEQPARECTEEERWAIEPKPFAVMKKGNKRAVKLFEKEEDALDFMLTTNDPKHYLEVRVGEPTRCMHYCSVSKFCPQFKRERI
jgi:hypothetical protein